jgi:hypothetical protein
METVCAEMVAWGRAASTEAMAARHYRTTGELPDFDTQLELRIATIGMYATIYLMEDDYDHELPPEFHAHPTVRTLKRLSNVLVGVGNDLFSFGKDLAEGHINLVSTLMLQSRLSAEEAIARLIRMHDDAVAEFDALGATLGGFGAETDALLPRWLRDIRYASLGFTRWEAQAPRYRMHQVVVGGRVLELDLG